jgi:WD40 repeat protein
VILRDVAGRRPDDVFEVPGVDVSGLAFSPGGNLLAVGYGIGGLRPISGVILYDMAGRLWNNAFEVPGVAVSGVSWGPDGTSLAVGYRNADPANGGMSAGGGVRLYAVAGNPLGDFPVPGVAVTGAALSPDGNTLAMGSSDPGPIARGRVILRDVAGRRPDDVFEVPGVDVTGVAFSPDGQTVATGYANVVEVGRAVPRRHVGGGVDLYDLSGRRLRNLFQTGGVGVSGVAFSADGQTVAVGYGGMGVFGVEEGGVILHDVAGRRPDDVFEVPHIHALGVAFSPDSKTVAMGYRNAGPAASGGGVALYDVARRRQLGDLHAVREGEVQGVAFSPDGKTLAAGYRNPDPAAVGGVALYDIDPESWQHRACRIANRNLSWDEWIRYIGSNVPYQRLCPDLPNGKDVDEALGRGDTEGH